MIDSPVPTFELPATSGRSIGPRALLGQAYVLYFYPKDNTPGCTAEGQQFRDLHADFRRLRCEVFGISRDSVRSHESFKAKMSFPFELISDPYEHACSAFGVIKMKNMYGRAVRGIERSTFVIDSAGMVRGEWRGVKVPGHAQAVLDFVRDHLR